MGRHTHHHHHPRVVHGSRSGAASPHPATVVVGPETRHLWIFMGAEFLNFDGTHQVLTDPTSFSSARTSSVRDVRHAVPTVTALPPIPLTPLVDDGGRVAHADRKRCTFENHTQRINYIIHWRGQLDEFKTQLQNPNAAVIYQGHARYGRGPCFGPAGSPPANHGEFWNDGLTSHEGIFRMGQEWLSVTGEEISSHQYHTNLAIASDTVDMTRADPDLVHHRRDITNKALSAVDPATAAAFVRNAGPTTLVPWYRASEEHHGRDWVIVPAGARHLRQITVRCKLFAHMGCSTQPHNAAVYRGIVGPVTGDAKRAAWTTATSRIWGLWFFLYHYLTFPEVCAGQPYGRQFRYAVRHATQSLIQARSPWRIASA